MARVATVRAVLCICAFVAPSARGDGRGICPDDAPQHSGYLNAGGDAKYFYYFAESRSPTSAQDPLVLWMTGGPGCSSILALLTENGPCSVQHQPKLGDSETIRNPWSWSEVANVIWVDQPIGVGYSSPGQKLDATEEEVADNMLIFLQSFYAKYPHFLNVPFFVTGESYGGHYIPAVAARVFRAQGQGVGRLAGIAIGNGLVDPTVQFASNADMALNGGVGGSLGKGLVDARTYEEMAKNKKACIDAIKTCQRHTTSQNCINGMNICGLDEIMPIAKTGLNPYDLRIKCSVPANGMCYNISAETAFLNSPDVKAKLGVPETRTWEACNMTTTVPFITSGDELMSYRNDVSELLDNDIGVLVYAGDTDFMVDWLGCRAWVAKMPWRHQEDWLAAPNVPFLLHDERRGMVQSSHGLTFMQVYNSGHMVPADQPEVALAMLTEFLRERTFAMRASIEDFAKGPMDAHISWSALPVTLVFVALAVVMIQIIRRMRRGRSDEVYYLMA